MFIVLFFFFKQKTAYEMRISDWSSDVCSSDLLVILRLVLDWPELRLRITATRYLRSSGISDDLFAHRVIEAVVNIEPLEDRTNLAAVEESEGENGGSDGFNICIRQHDRDVIAAKLTRQSLERGRDRSPDRAPPD